MLLSLGLQLELTEIPGLHQKQDWKGLPEEVPSGQNNCPLRNSQTEKDWVEQSKMKPRFWVVEGLKDRKRKPIVTNVRLLRRTLQNEQKI